MDSIFAKKANGTEVNYFIFDEYEIHLNNMPPNSIQEWHKHLTIEESLLVTKGEVSVKWRDDKREYSKKVTKDMIVRVKDSIHTIENITNEWAKFVVFRMVPSGESKRDIIKNDKINIL
ncbi:cupin domain-containing protein [Clostridium sp. HBUAS56017]|nr:cupin domain-containing protein [Clostridium sp. HBUAS56017]